MPDDHRLSTAGRTALLFAAMFTPLRTEADVIHWQGGNDDWFNDANWADQSQGGAAVLPGSSDAVTIGNGAGPDISSGDARADTQFIGTDATGTLNQTGGTNTVGANLYVGDGSAGLYSLSGTGSLNVSGTENIAWLGPGTFAQSGGTNSIHSQLLVSHDPASPGTYTLAGGTVDSQFAGQVVGFVGPGTFHQSGGLNNLYYSSLSLGWAGQGSGTYTLGGAGVLTALSESVGHGAAGTFVQTGGTNTINADGVPSYAGSLNVAALPGSTGSYTLAGGTLDVNGDVYVGGSSAGPGGTGVLAVSRPGQLTVTGTVVIYPNGHVNIGAGDSTIGALSIMPGGSITVDGPLVIDYAGHGPSPIASIQTALENGYDAGKWDGPGVTSDLMDSRMSVGFIDTGAQIIIRPALIGDANLDGKLNADDYALLDRSYAKQPTDPHWTDGDFNYDGIINTQDYLLIDKTFLIQAQGLETLGLLAQRESQFGEQYVSTLLASVPEPALPLSSILYPLSSLLLHRRRPRRLEPR